MSWSISATLDYSDVTDRINDLHDAGVYIVSSIGNTGQNSGNTFPQRHQYVYAVGSIDHDNGCF